MTSSPGSPRPAKTQVAIGWNTHSFGRLVLIIHRETRGGAPGGDAEGYLPHPAGRGGHAELMAPSHG